MIDIRVQRMGGLQRTGIRHACCFVSPWQRQDRRGKPQKRASDQMLDWDQGWDVLALSHEGVRVSIGRHYELRDKKGTYVREYSTSR
jgi:hypothetical protein